MVVLDRRRLDRCKPVRIEATSLLQQAILDGHLRPGQEVPQLKLADQLRLSQTTIREALQELEHRGLIIKKGRTRTVVSLSIGELGDMYQIRGLLEPFACHLAAYHWTDAADREAEECLALAERAAAEKNQREFVRVDLEFHRVIWKHQPNRHLERHLNIVCVPMLAYDLVKRAIQSDLDFNRTMRQHRLMLSVVRTGDGLRAEKVVRRLIERFHRQDVSDYMRLDRSGRLAAQPS